MGTWARWAADPSTWFLSELSHPTVVQADGPECPTPGVCHPSLKFSEHGLSVLDGLSQIPGHAYPPSAVVASVVRIMHIETWQTQDSKLETRHGGDTGTRHADIDVNV